MFVHRLCKFRKVAGMILELRPKVRKIRCGAIKHPAEKLRRRFRACALALRKCKNPLKPHVPMVVEPGVECDWIFVKVWV